MRVLTTRGGELAVPSGPLCDNPDCTSCHDSHAASNPPTPTDTVAENDITLDDLTAACTDFLHRTGWADSF